MPFATAAELLAKKAGPAVSIASGATVLEALQMMVENNAGLLPVTEGGGLVGVLSERDCARRVVLEQRPAATTLVRDIMKTKVHTVPRHAKIPECITLMHEKTIGHLPVVRGTEVLGVLSVRDVMGALIERHERLLRRLREEQLMLFYPDPGSY